MTDAELKDVRQLVLALKRVHGVEGRCLWCSRPIAYGCVCSCPRRLALKAAARLMGGDQSAQDELVAALVTELRDSGRMERLAWGLTEQDDPLLVERAADVIDALIGREQRG